MTPTDWLMLVILLLAFAFACDSVFFGLRRDRARADAAVFRMMTLAALFEILRLLSAPASPPPARPTSPTPSLEASPRVVPRPHQLVIRDPAGDGE